MSDPTCPSCGADLTATQSVRIAEYSFGRLQATDQKPVEGPGFTYERQKPDTYTLLCNACRRLIRTLPLS